MPYDQVASGAIIYAYVGGNPVNAIDPLGLYELLNCSPSQATKISEASCSAQDAANKQGIGDEISKILQKVTFECKSIPICGVNKEPVSTKDYVNHSIVLDKSALNSASQCGPLKATILHELSHSYPLHYNEGNAFILEKSAFPEAKIPTPDQFQELYKYISPQIFEDYRIKYNEVMGR